MESHQVTEAATTAAPGSRPRCYPLPLYNKPSMCEGLQKINKAHDTFDVMDDSTLPSALTSSLVVALTVAIHPDQQ